MYRFQQFVFLSPLQTIYDESGEAAGFEYTSLRTHPTYIVAYVMWYR